MSVKFWELHFLSPMSREHWRTKRDELWETGNKAKTQWLELIEKCLVIWNIFLTWIYTKTVLKWMLQMRKLRSDEMNFSSACLNSQIAFDKVWGTICMNHNINFPRHIITTFMWNHIILAGFEKFCENSFCNILYFNQHLRWKRKSFIKINFLV